MLSDYALFIRILVACGPPPVDLKHVGTIVPGTEILLRVTILPGTKIIVPGTKISRCNYISPSRRQH